MEVERKKAQEHVSLGSGRARSVRRQSTRLAPTTILNLRPASTSCVRYTTILPVSSDCQLQCGGVRRVKRAWRPGACAYMRTTGWALAGLDECGRGTGSTRGVNLLLLQSFVCTSVSIYAPTVKVVRVVSSSTSATATLSLYDPTRLGRCSAAHGTNISGTRAAVTVRSNETSQDPAGSHVLDQWLTNSGHRPRVTVNFSCHTYQCMSS
ncbi:hypothetical protein PENSPDRAFT_137654 [Peniophora sp. CONT]|nr:hypothetical protein PENSPDRAFT_137654 [Peniophora sp. CONT]